MHLRRLPWPALLLLAAPLAASAGTQKPCVTAEQAAKMLNKDVCISAHVYDVVELPDGTRFLDVCTPQTTDDACRFTIISPWEDHDDVGELRKYRDMDVQVRGIVQPMHGRSGMVLSHAGSRLLGRPEPATRQRSQSPLAGHWPLVHEHPRQGTHAGKVNPVRAFLPCLTTTTAPRFGAVHRGNTASPATPRRRDRA
jgi:hypothetical protein